MLGNDGTMVLRFAGPLQSWGVRSQFNRRETAAAPTKSGIVGLLAAAQGRLRVDSIDDLTALTIGVRTDRSGSLLRDYHTVSDFRGRDLLSAKVNARGMQGSSGTPTKVTTRFYLEDAVFVVAVGGPRDTLDLLAAAVQRPAFPLALGRRSCVPTQPILLKPAAGQGAEGADELWAGDPLSVLARVPSQAAEARRRGRSGMAAASPSALAVTIDDPEGDDVAIDVPLSFAPRERAFAGRRVRHAFVRPGDGRDDEAADAHDPFALLGW